MDTLIAEYGGTVSSAAKRKLFEVYKDVETSYRSAQDKILQAGRDPKTSHEELTRRIGADLHPEFPKAQAAATAVVDHNKAEAVESTELIDASVEGAKVGVLVSVSVALIAACLCGYFLLRAISQLSGFVGQGSNRGFM